MVNRSLCLYECGLSESPESFIYESPRNWPKRENKINWPLVTGSGESASVTGITGEPGSLESTSYCDTKHELWAHSNRAKKGPNFKTAQYNLVEQRVSKNLGDYDFYTGKSRISPKCDGTFDDEVHLYQLRVSCAKILRQLNPVSSSSYLVTSQSSYPVNWIVSSSSSPVSSAAAKFPRKTCFQCTQRSLGSQVTHSTAQVTGRAGSFSSERLGFSTVNKSIHFISDNNQGNIKSNNSEQRGNHANRKYSVIQPQNCHLLVRPSCFCQSANQSTSTGQRFTVDQSTKLLMAPNRRSIPTLPSLSPDNSSETETWSKPSFDSNGATSNCVNLDNSKIIYINTLPNQMMATSTNHIAVKNVASTINNNNNNIINNNKERIDCSYTRSSVTSTSTDVWRNWPKIDLISSIDPFESTDSMISAFACVAHVINSDSANEDNDDDGNNNIDVDEDHKQDHETFDNDNDSYDSSNHPNSLESADNYRPTYSTNNGINNKNRATLKTKVNQTTVNNPSVAITKPPPPPPLSTLPQPPTLSDHLYETIYPSNIRLHRRPSSNGHYQNYRSILEARELQHRRPESFSENSGDFRFEKNSDKLQGRPFAILSENKEPFSRENIQQIDGRTPLDPHSYSHHHHHYNNNHHKRSSLQITPSFQSSSSSSSMVNNHYVSSKNHQQLQQHQNQPNQLTTANQSTASSKSKTSNVSPSHSNLHNSMVDNNKPESVFESMTMSSLPCGQSTSLQSTTTELPTITALTAKTMPTTSDLKPDQVYPSSSNGPIISRATVRPTEEYATINKIRSPKNVKSATLAGYTNILKDQTNLDITSKDDSVTNNNKTPSSPSPSLTRPESDESKAKLASQASSPASPTDETRPTFKAKEKRSFFRRFFSLTSSAISRTFSVEKIDRHRSVDRSLNRFGSTSKGTMKAISRSTPALTSGRPQSASSSHDLNSPVNEFTNQPYFSGNFNQDSSNQKSSLNSQSSTSVQPASSSNKTSFVRAFKNRMSLRRSRRKVKVKVDITRTKSEPKGSKNQNQNEDKFGKISTNDEDVWGSIISTKGDAMKIVEINRSPGRPFGFFVARGTVNNIKGIFISRIDSMGERAYQGLLEIGDRLIDIDGNDVTEASVIQVNQLMAHKTKLTLKIVPFSAHKAK